MKLDRTFAIPPRTFHGAFREYVRSVFADLSPRRHAVRTGRALWLNGFAPRASTSAEQRWDDEGGRNG